MISAEDNKKRKQRIECETVGDTVFTVIVEENPTAENTALDIIGTITVSYTHLTLPTNSRV